MGEYAVEHAVIEQHNGYQRSSLYVSFALSNRVLFNVTLL